MTRPNGAGTVSRVKMVRAGVLDVDYEEYGDPRGWPVVLLHGFPYDPRCFDEAAPALAAGRRLCRRAVPAGLRADRVPRRRHAAIGSASGAGPRPRRLDRHPRARVADRGRLRLGRSGRLPGRGACGPRSVSGLVTVDGYNVQDIADANTPAAPATESALWYQYYLHGERGRAGLAAYRRDFARLLWAQWSPTWRFTDADFAASAAVVRQPRLRRRRRAFLPAPLRSGRRRPGL